MCHVVLYLFYRKIPTCPENDLLRSTLSPRVYKAVQEVPRAVSTHTFTLLENKVQRKSIHSVRLERFPDMSIDWSVLPPDQLCDVDGGYTLVAEEAMEIYREHLSNYMQTIEVFDRLLKVSAYESSLDIPLFVKDLFLSIQLTKETPYIHSRRRTFRGIIDGQLDSIRKQNSTYYTMTKDRFLREIISVHDSVSSCNPSYLARRYLTLVPMFAFSRPSADGRVSAYEALKLEIELSK